MKTNLALQLFNEPFPVRVLCRVIARRLHIGSYSFRLSIGAVVRPNYAYLVNQAARLAARLGQPAYDPQGRSYRGFNPFLEQDERVLQTLLRGEHALAGVTARRLRSLLEGWTRSRVSRLLKRFRLHGLLRKIGHTYTYHLTPLARRVVTAVLDIKNTMMIPQLAASAV